MYYTYTFKYIYIYIYYIYFQICITYIYIYIILSRPAEAARSGFVISTRYYTTNHTRGEPNPSVLSTATTTNNKLLKLLLRLLYE